MGHLLEINNLDVKFDTDEGRITAIHNVSLTLDQGKVLGIVGESGSGKSVTAKSIMQLNPGNTIYNDNAEIIIDDENVLKFKSKHDLKKIRGGKVSMIFQEPMASFAPAIKIGNQMVEQLMIHKPMNKKEAKNISIDMLNRVGIADADKRFNQYAFELSGGMRQRAMIAMALSTMPKLLLADEPTTALDVTIQSKILELLVELRDERNMGLILITHDLGEAAKVADNVIVLKNGEIVESGSLRDVFINPKGFYTKQLMNSIPGRLTSLNTKIKTKKNQPILEVKNISKVYDTIACDDVSFNLFNNEILGVVGESGSGKTTISNLILRLIEPSSGTILYHGKNIFDFDKKDLFNFRRKVQVVFQDPYASLNPTMNVYDIISEPWVIHSDFLQKQFYTERVSDLLTSVGLQPDDAQKYPHQFSGGQRQRIAIARALALNPEIIICDEAVSSLDVSIQAQIIKLLSDLRNKFSLSYLFIAHDLQVVRDLADRVIVMKAGKIVEQGNISSVFAYPNEQYTKDLLNASLSIDKIIN